MMSEAMDPERQKALGQFVEFLDSNGFDWNSRYISTTEPGREYEGTFGGQDGNNFFMHDGSSIIVGNAVDIPDGTKNGDHISFTTAPELEPKPPISQRLERLAQRYTATDHDRER